MKEKEEKLHMQFSQHAELNNPKVQSGSKLCS